MLEYLGFRNVLGMLVVDGKNNYFFKLLMFVLGRY